MDICWKRAVLLAFNLCGFYFSVVLIIVSLSRLVFRAGCGIRLYRFLIVAILSSLQGDHFSKNIFPGCSKYRSQILILGIIKPNL